MQVLHYFGECVVIRLSADRHGFEFVKSVFNELGRCALEEIVVLQHRAAHLMVLAVLFGELEALFT